MQNYPLLAEIGRSGRPALLKRGLSATLDELLMAAEYILKEGNPNVMLCERGIRTFETAYRFTLDLMAVPVLKELSHLPVIVDPSHAAGRRDLVTPLSLAAAAVGADGIIVEVHPNPDEAICDGPQPLRAEDFAEYARAVEQRGGARGQGARRQGAGPCLSVPGAQLRPADYVRDRRIERVVPLLAPDALLEELALSREQADVVIRGRREVDAVLDGADARLLAVVGPCSVHDPDATLEYAALPRSSSPAI